MNKEEIDKWLDNEYGCSYTRLEELHDYYFEKYTDQKEEIQRLKNELLSKPDNEITLTTKDGQELTIIQSERIDMQKKLNKSLEEMYKKYNDYKSRIDKATHLIGILLDKRNCFKNTKLDLMEVKNILTGGDEE